MTRQSSLMDVPAAGLLSWVLPGLGHLYLGHRTRGIVLLVTITLAYWTGVAVGGVHGTVDPRERTAWFIAQACNGGHTAAALLLRAATDPPPSEKPPRPIHGQPPIPPFYGNWTSIEIGTVYTAVTGLLTILIVLDALVRAEHGVRRRTPAAGGGVA